MSTNEETSNFLASSADEEEDSSNEEQVAGSRWVLVLGAKTTVDSGTFVDPCSLHGKLLIRPLVVCDKTPTELSPLRS